MTTPTATPIAPIEPIDFGHKCANCGERIDVMQTHNSNGVVGTWVHDRTGREHCRLPVVGGEHEQPRLA